VGARGKRSDRRYRRREPLTEEGAILLPLPACKLSSNPAKRRKGRGGEERVQEKVFFLWCGGGGKKKRVHPIFSRLKEEKRHSSTLFLRGGLPPEKEGERMKKIGPARRKGGKGKGYLNRGKKVSLSLYSEGL